MSQVVSSKANQSPAFSRYIINPSSRKVYEVCPEGIQPCTMKNKDIYWRRYKKHCIQDNDTSVPFRVGTLGPHTVLLIAISCPILFSWISSMVWNLFHFKGDFIITKARSHRAPNLGCRGAESPHDLMFCQKTLHKMWCMSGCVVLMKLPINSCP